MASTREVLISEDLGSTNSQGVKKLQVGSFKEERRIDIRVWDQFGPTTRGVSLTPQRWINLIERIPIINTAIKDVRCGLVPAGEVIKISIGGLHYVQVKAPYPNVDLRLYYEPKDGSTPKPSRKGVNLKLNEWKRLIELIKPLYDAFPALNTIEACVCKEHVNADTMCSEKYQTKRKETSPINEEEEGQDKLVEDDSPLAMANLTQKSPQKSQPITLDDVDGISASPKGMVRKRSLSEPPLRPSYSHVAEDALEPIVKRSRSVDLPPVAKAPAEDSGIWGVNDFDWFID